MRSSRFSSRTRPGVVLGLSTILVTAACSLIVDTKADQCTTDADCKSLLNQPAAVCQSGVCLASAVDGAGSDATSSNDGPGEEGSGGDACVPKIPTTQDDFLNETCTSAECIPFDNCARLAICDGGALPALVAPPDGGF